jgi:hypothetical protein
MLVRHYLASYEVHEVALEVLCSTVAVACLNSISLTNCGYTQLNSRIFRWLAPSGLEAAGSHSAKVTDNNGREASGHSTSRLQSSERQQLKFGSNYRVLYSVLRTNHLTTASLHFGSFKFQQATVQTDTV